MQQYNFSHYDYTVPTVTDYAENNIGYNEKIRSNSKALDYRINRNYYLLGNECLQSEPGYLNTRQSGIVDTVTESNLRNYNIPLSKMVKYNPPWHTQTYPTDHQALNGAPTTTLGSGSVVAANAVGTMSGFNVPCSRQTNGPFQHTNRMPKSSNQISSGFFNTFYYLFYNPQLTISSVHKIGDNSRTRTREIKEKAVQSVLPGKIKEMEKYMFN